MAKKVESKIKKGRLKLKKETLRDLKANAPERVKGGLAGNTLKVGCSLGCPTLGCP